MKVTFKDYLTPRYEAYVEMLGIGERDVSVPVESAQYLETKFKEAGKGNLTLRVYPGADHRLSGNGVSYRSEFFAELSRLLQQTHNTTLQGTLRDKAAQRP